MYFYLALMTELSVENADTITAQRITSMLAAELMIRVAQVNATIELLDGGATVPDATPARLGATSAKLRSPLRAAQAQHRQTARQRVRSRKLEVRSRSLLQTVLGAR